MNVENINNYLFPERVIIDAKSMNSHEKLKCKVCGSVDLTIVSHKIMRGFENCIEFSVACNNYENWGEVFITNYEQNEFYADIIKDLEALEREKEQLHADLAMKLEEDLFEKNKDKKGWK